MSGLEDIPLIGDVAGVAIHGAEAIGDAVTGDWDGAADQAQSMAGSAIGVATGGISTAVEDVYDELAPHAGLPSSHELGHDVLQTAGNALGDGAYDLMHGSDDGGLGGGDPLGGAGGAGGGDDSSSGGDFGGSGDDGSGYDMSGGDGGEY